MLALYRLLSAWPLGLLHAVGGAETLPADAGTALARLATDPAEAARMGANARVLLRKRAGDAAPLVAAILAAAGIAASPPFDLSPSESIAADAPDTDIVP